jgi:glutathione S-transferase
LQLHLWSWRALTGNVVCTPKETTIMKLYFHPVSTTCRTVMLFASEAGIDLDYQLVDLMTGAHLAPEYRTINPNCLVPVLEDGDFRLTESSAILKYLAEKIGSPTYPKDLRQRAKVNEMMDWLVANFYRDYAYGLIYPQVFPHHKRPSDDVQKATLEWGQERAAVWLKLLDQHWIGPKNNYLCGNEVTVADYLGSGLVTLGEVVGCDFKVYPNVQRWLGNMRKLKSWPKVNEVFNGLVASNKDKAFVTV